MNVRKLSDVDRAEIAALKARGKSSASIAIKYGISSDAVRRIAKKVAADGMALLKECGCTACVLTFEATV